MAKNIISKKKKYALVTGAGTGLGFVTAELLAKNGYTVWGTIIPSQSPKELEKIPNVTPLVMDITDPKMVKEGFDLIEKEVGENGLSALLNIAALAAIAGGIIEGVSEDRIRALMEVNLFGTIRMCQTFLPLLRKYGPARIVNVTSSGCRVPAPFSGIYAISKFAIMGITNSLRLELAPFGIQATSIEPAAMDTPMTANPDENMAKTWASMPPHIKELYYPKIEYAQSIMNAQMKEADPPIVLAKIILKALKKKKMRMRYTGGKGAKNLPKIIRLLGENTFESMLKKNLKINPTQ